ncbi:SDR family NAD(P)-dependent oxidoreductase [Halorientalis halophila]|uniref:SDR family NAD(P)-dependent oxidoreductase n=1 Tax=Halorientalis halophila TaxID=3108499 RepID=UPI00300A466D
MPSDIDGATAVVTGSSSGIGERIATTFAEAGANVVTNSRSQERAESTAADIRDAGGTAIAVEADVSEKADAEKLVDAAVEEFGSVDVMVNNAGVLIVSPILELTEEKWREVIDVNLTGVFFGAQAAGEQMAAQPGDGRIINISSIFGSVGVQGRGPYNAAKGAVDNLTRALAVDLAEHDVQVNALAPGFVRSDLNRDLRADEGSEALNDAADWPYYDYDDRHIENRTPMGRFGTLEEVANCALFLASGDHYMTGEIVHADGGWLAFGWGSTGR